MTIVIIDYGMGNIGALIKMFNRLGHESKVSNSKSEIERASHLILPGVGSFSRAVQRLGEIKNLRSILNEVVLSKQTPILGICLGMQLLFASSEEGTGEGLGWLPGSVKKFSSTEGIRVPHMGWNNVNSVVEHPISEELRDGARFYFVHSYFTEPAMKEHLVMTTSHGCEFASVVVKNNVVGVQFHPEKSHKYGLILLRNFVEKC